MGRGMTEGTSCSLPCTCCLPPVLWTHLDRWEVGHDTAVVVEESMWVEGSPSGLSGTSLLCCGSPFARMGCLVSSHRALAAGLEEVHHHLAATNPLAFPHLDDVP